MRVYIYIYLVPNSITTAQYYHHARVQNYPCGGFKSFLQMESVLPLPHTFFPLTFKKSVHQCQNCRWCSQRNVLYHASLLCVFSKDLCYVFQICTSHISVLKDLVHNFSVQNISSWNLFICFNNTVIYALVIIATIFIENCVSTIFCMFSSSGPFNITNML